jgi:hypothetical protein
VWQQDVERVLSYLGSFDAEGELERVRAEAAGWAGANILDDLRVPLAGLPWQDATLPRSSEPRPGSPAVALDAEGREIAMVWDWAAPDEQIRDVAVHHPDGVMVLSTFLWTKATWRSVTRSGQVTYVVSASDAESGGVARYTYAEGRAIRVDRANESEANVMVLECDEHGEPVRGLRVTAQVETSGTLVQRLETALSHAEQLTPTELFWEASIERAEPWPEDWQTAVRELAIHLDEAVARIIGSGRPWLVGVHAGGEPEFPPAVWLVDRAAQARARRVRGDVIERVARARGLSCGGASKRDVGRLLGEDALRMVRAINTARRTRANPVRGAEMKLLLDELTVRLAARSQGAWLPLVFYHGYDAHAAGLALDRARGAMGDDAVSRLLAPIDGPAPKKPTKAALATAARNRDALQRFLVKQSIEADAQRLAHEVAEFGLRLCDRDGARSRLGGPALLPLGVDWPSSPERQLTFLAALDLAELGTSDPFPTAGWLLCFADLGTEDGGDGLTAPAANVDGAFARLFYTDDPQPATAPAGEHVTLGQWRVSAVPELTIPGERTPGVSAADQGLLDDALSLLADRDREPGHWVGGRPDTIQGPFDLDEILLFRLDHDERIGFEYLDAAHIDFRIPRAALAVRNWSAVIADAVSS